MEDANHHCYGLAWVMLAYATALKAGVAEARTGLDRVHALMDRRFLESHSRLYAVLVRQPGRKLA